jgi:hypothetical protein
MRPANACTVAAEGGLHAADARALVRDGVGGVSDGDLAADGTCRAVRPIPEGSPRRSPATASSCAADGTRSRVFGNDVDVVGIRDSTGTVRVAARG